MDGQKPDNVPTGTPTQFVPGDTIRPQQTAPNAEPAAPANDPAASQPTLPPPVVMPETSSPPVNPPQPAVAPTAPPPSTPAAAAPLAYEYYQPAAEPAQAPAEAAGDEVIRWTASEFIAHHKTGGWYALLLLAACVAAVFIWLITKDIVSSIVVIFAGGILATYATRQPRQLSYQLDPSGLTIGDRHYGYHDFRSFTVIPEGAFDSIIFMPLKRFGTLTTIYFDPQDEERIVELISQRLPHEERKLDPIDSMMRRIRF